MQIDIYNFLYLLHCPIIAVFCTNLIQGTASLEKLQLNKMFPFIWIPIIEMIPQALVIIKHHKCLTFQFELKECYKCIM